MPARNQDTPGLQRRPRDDGSVALYWVALSKAIKAGYQPKTVRLNYPVPDPDPAPELCRRCQDLQAQMDAWMADPARDRLIPALLRTIKDLTRLYSTHRLSPYARIEDSSRQHYDALLRQLDQTVGHELLAPLQGITFREWHMEFMRPKREGASEHTKYAHGLMSMLRHVLGFGAECGVPHAKRLRDLIGLIRFPLPPPRKEHLTFEMVVKFIAKAHELGFREMAFAQALQFDLTLRQFDVIGKRHSKTKEWIPGLLWQHIDKELVLTYTPNKTKKTTGKVVNFDLNEYELVMAELKYFETIPEVGPMIIDSQTGLPFHYKPYWKRWRKIAALVGIPKTVWNRDSRAGGVTEGRDAGADLDDVRQHAGHSKVETTRIYDRESLEKTKRVAKARSEYRNRA